MHLICRVYGDPLSFDLYMSYEASWRVWYIEEIACCASLHLHTCCDEMSIFFLLVLLIFLILSESSYYCFSTVINLKVNHTTIPVYVVYAVFLQLGTLFQNLNYDTCSLKSYCFNMKIYCLVNFLLSCAGNVFL